MLGWLIIAGIAIFTILFFARAWLTKRRIIRMFRENNVMVFGRRGKGKDLLFQEIIACRHEGYQANISYGYKQTRQINGNSLSVAPNTYEDFINGNITTIKKDESLERVDAYFSDAGTIFPSQMDSKLHREFPSLPIYYALSRHLYASNIHLNTQNLERVWKALREQADYFIQCRGVIHLPFMLIIRTTEYDKYKSALAELLPVKGGGLFNSFKKAETAVYNATNGYIQDGYFIVWKRHIKYDTRAYHKILFGYDAPSRKKNKPKKRRPLPHELPSRG